MLSFGIKSENYTGYIKLKLYKIFLAFIKKNNGDFFNKFDIIF